VYIAFEEAPYQSRLLLRHHMTSTPARLSAPMAASAEPVDTLASATPVKEVCLRLA
jgi:hypothetical protein